MATTPVFSLEDVGLTFRAHGKPVPVLLDFHLDVMPGERVALRGASGAGKSTVLDLMAGFLAPTRGRVLFDGRDLHEFTSGEIAAFRNREIGIVHQFFNLIPSFSSLANVAAPLVIAGCRRKEAGERALEMLERVGVAGKAEHRPRELSGGEQQRVAIARALIRRPRVILADEPTGNLDPATSAVILELLGELAGDHTTMVLATHARDVTAFASKVVDLEPRG